MPQVPSHGQIKLIDSLPMRLKNTVLSQLGKMLLYISPKRVLKNSVEEWK